MSRLRSESRRRSLLTDKRSRGLPARPRSVPHSERGQRVRKVQSSGDLKRTNEMEASFAGKDRTSYPGRTGVSRTISQAQGKCQQRPSGQDVTALERRRPIAGRGATATLLFLASCSPQAAEDAHPVTRIRCGHSCWNSRSRLGKTSSGDAFTRIDP